MAEQKKKPGRPPGSKNKNTAAAAKDLKTPKEERVKLTAEQLTRKKRIHDEIWAIILMALGAFLAISLQTNATGQLGHTLQVFFKGSFGFLAFVLPYYLILYGLLLFAKRTAHIGGRSVFFLILIYLMATIMNSTRFLEGVTAGWSLGLLTSLFDGGVELDNGGVFGMAVGLLLDGVIGVTGIWILCGVIVLISILLVINTPFSQFLDGWKLKRQATRAEQAAEDETMREAQALMAAEAAAASTMNTAETTAKEKAALTAPKPKMTEAAATGTGEGAARDLPGTPAPPQDVPTVRPGRTAGQMKIIDYMKDDSLFGGGSGGGSGYGLEEAARPAAGMGLEPGAGTKQQPGLGLDGTAPEAVAARARLIGKDTKEMTEPVKASEIKLSNQSNPEYIMPSIDLLEKPKATAKPGETAELKAKAKKLEDTLQNFGVNAHILQVTKGPTVTRYEVQPDVGVKVSSIVRLADDIALNLEAKSIRIEAPIPGKAAVGIEVENERVNMVVLREILDSKEFKNAKSKISFAVGKDISGNAIVADLKSMPHMLIAGSTGSGKSVCINSIIISILYKARPEEVKFVLVDPKVVELGHYNSIPHMLIPVVTEPSKAAAALNWAVAEMTDRYKKFAETGVRDLESYNGAVREKGEADLVLPQIVIIIDELADLMMAAPSQVEESICRLAQMARAAGMHLIVATQRPSVDVITGVIKANIPSRVAFAVSSQFDSRTILDMSGAEKLVGKGDMLFNPLGMAKPLRVQGAFVSDREVNSVIEFLKGQNSGQEQQYAGDVIASIEQNSGNGNGGHQNDSDELLPEAIETVVRAEQASVSMLQRRFRIGYNRAARLVDMMEDRGVIGPADGSRPRQVLLSVDQWMAINAETEGVQEAGAGEKPEA